MTREKERPLTSAILLVVHEEELELLHVADAELEETIGHQEAGLRVRAVANLDVHGSALEVTTGASIHTVGLAPGLLCIQKESPQCTHVTKCGGQFKLCPWLTISQP